MRPRVETLQAPDRLGDRLIVREAARRDAPRYVEHVTAIVAETEFMLQGPADRVPEPDEQRALLGHLARLPNCVALVATRPSGGPGRDRIVGSLTLLGGQTSRTRHVCQLGMGVRKDEWGRGVGGHLLDVALTWARANPMLVRVALQVYVSNESARHLYLGRGFTEEGRMRHEVRLDDGSWEDLVGMACLVG